MFSAATMPTADIVALPASSESDGTLVVPPNGDYAFFSVASTNLGATSSIRLEPTVSGVPNAEVVVCQTNVTSGACMATPAGSVLLDIAAGETPSFAVFVRVPGGVVYDPAHNRVSVTFLDTEGVIRGRTSLALR